MSETAPKPILCYVTDRRVFAGTEAQQVKAVLRAVRVAVAAGVDWVQIREKDLPARRLVDFVERAVETARGSATKIVVNDRLDVALAAAAHGVHLGGASAPVADVVAWLKTRAEATKGSFLVGASCHSLAAAQAAEHDGANYIFFGPVYATPAKQAYGPPQGVARLTEICRSVRLPVMAIGGITAENAVECLRAGAAGIAAIRLFQESSDVSTVMALLRAAR